MAPAPPAEFQTLSASDQEHLENMIDTAAQERSRKLDDATEQALRFIPKMLRGTVKRALGI